VWSVAEILRLFRAKLPQGGYDLGDRPTHLEPAKRFLKCLTLIATSTLGGGLLMAQAESAIKRILLQHSFEHRVCSHLDSIQKTAPDWFECRSCNREGTASYHLRMCLVCGEVGCCDSSEARHARSHNEESGHQLIRSIEPGERWVWCFEDRAYLGGLLERSDIVSADLSSDTRLHPALRIAAALSALFGIGVAVIMTITLVFLFIRGEPPAPWGFLDWARGGFFEEAGLSAWRAGVTIALLATVSDVVIGRQLRFAWRRGGYFTLGKLPIDVWWVVGSGVPVVAAIVYPVRLILVLLGWRQLRPSTRENPG